MNTTPEPKREGSSRVLDKSTPPSIVTLVLIAGTAALSMNIFLPSMPGIAATFATDYAVVQLAISAYLAMIGVLNLVIGPLSDRYGRRLVLIFCFAVFVLASLGCFFAQSFQDFMLCRMLQTVVAAGMVLSRTIVTDLYPPSKSASMIGYVTMGMAVVPMVGPVIGGVLDEMFGWRASFALLAIFGTIVLMLIWVDLGETNQSRSSSFAVQLRRYPALFKSRRFWGYAVTAAFASGAFFAFLGGAPYVADKVLSMSQSATGAYFGIVAMGYLLGNWISGRFTAGIGLHKMMQVGTFAAVVGMLLALAFLASNIVHPLSIFGPTLLVGLGNGMTLPSAHAGMLAVRPEVAGTASGLGGALAIGGGAGFAALTGVLLGPGTGAWPLIGMMLAASLASVVAAAYTIRIEQQVAATEIGA